MKDAKPLHDRVRRQVTDGFDEELELDDDGLEKLLADIAEHPDRQSMDRRAYFKELDGQTLEDFDKDLGQPL